MSLPAEPHKNHPGATELAVILAAGEGSRLSPDYGGTPKPTLLLLGLSLVERAVVACLAAGIRKFVVVLGYRKNEVRAHMEKVAARRGCQVDFVIAEDWELGNGASALAASVKVNSVPFVLVMSDHLIAPSVVEAVLHNGLGEDEICLAVDRDKTGVFDLEDVTRVELQNGRVRQLGKSLQQWDAADTGVFRCTAALFEGLRRAAAQNQHSLTDGVNDLAAAGRVSAVDVTGQMWLDVDTPAGYREAKRRLLKSLLKPNEDGFVSTYINRPISTRLSALLATTPVSPNQITIIAFVVSLLGAWSLALGTYVTDILGAVLVQFASVVDGCDGEVARLKHLASARGAWLDTILDRYSDLVVTFAITLAYAADNPGVLIWAGGFWAGAGFILSGYVKKEFFLRHGYAYPRDIPARVNCRDSRLIAISLGAVSGRPFEVLIVVGILSHVCIVWILARGWFSFSAKS